MPRVAGAIPTASPGATTLMLNNMRVIAQVFGAVVWHSLGIVGKLSTHSSNLDIRIMTG